MLKRRAGHIVSKIIIIDIWFRQKGTYLYNLVTNADCVPGMI
jgi:hypothetical protein